MAPAAPHPDASPPGAPDPDTSPSDAPYTAETWPIAAAMLPFGSKDSRGGPIHDAEPEEWARHLRVVRGLGFSEVDPTDTWVRPSTAGTSRWST